MGPVINMGLNPHSLQAHGVIDRGYLSPRAAAAFHEPTPLDGLSGQQRQLNISVRTLESYCARMIDKLGMHGVKELRQQAIRDAGVS